MRSLRAAHHPQPTNENDDAAFLLPEQMATFSDAHAERFHLYRVFGFRRNPRIFTLLERWLRVAR